MRGILISLAAMLGSVLSAQSVLAQGLDEPHPDREKVILVTAVVALGAAGLAGVGYLYRRVKGMAPGPEEGRHLEHRELHPAEEDTTEAAGRGEGQH